MPYSVAHLVDYLYELGPTCGQDAIPWVELDRWAERTGVVLGSFAATTLISLSRIYLSQFRQAMEANCPPPEIRRNELPTRTEVSNALRDMLRQMSASMAKSKKRQAARPEKKGAKP